MGNPLSHLQDELFQLHVHAVSVVCIVEPDAILAVYSNDEGPREAVGTRHGVEEGVRHPRLGVCTDRIKETHGFPLRSNPRVFF